jgi:hypothetical protein
LVQKWIMHLESPDLGVLGAKDADAYEAMAASSGEVIKLIGDEAMVVADSPDATSLMALAVKDLCGSR